MKITPFKSLLLVGAAALTTACSSDFLETEPTNRVPGDKQNELLIQNPEKIEAIISGAYWTNYCGDPYMSEPQDDWGMSSYMIAADVMCEDISSIMNTGQFAFDAQLIFREPDYRRPVSMWRQFYYIISSVNSAIGVLKEFEGTSDEIDAMYGQALAMRAWSYFWLINFWQHPYQADPEAMGVPIYVEDATKNVLHRAPVKDVYALMDTDLAKACTLLKGKQLGKSAINEYAAAGIYANVLMFMGRYADAATQAEYAAKGGTLGNETELMSGFKSLSMSEVLWGFTVTEDACLVFGSFMAHMNPYVDGYAPPTFYPKLAGSYLVSKIDPRDVRKKWFGYNAAFNVSEFDFSALAAAGFDAYVPNKFRCPDNFMADVIYMRVAEMYFIAAEAYYLNNDQTKARKALTDVMSTRIPGYDASGKSGDALYEEICIQKRIEMWGEGRRIFDAKRRNETIDRTKSNNFAAALEVANAMRYSGRDYRLIYKVPNVEMENNEYITPDQQNP